MKQFLIAMLLVVCGAAIGALQLDAEYKRVYPANIIWIGACDEKTTIEENNVKREAEVYWHEGDYSAMLSGPSCDAIKAKWGARK